MSAAPSSPNEKADIAMVVVAPITDGSNSTTPSPTDNADTNKPTNGYLARFRALFGDWFYFWEVLGITLSAASIASICIVVDHFNNEPPPVWSATVHVPVKGKQTAQLTLNALLSILSVLGSTCAMIPVTKGLGQLKYIWFIQQDRKLADLEMFDSASRGTLGSAQLIWKLRLKHLAVFGALASLLALAYGPFVQNLVTITVDWQESNDESEISFVDSVTYVNTSGVTGSSPTMRFMVNSALLDQSDDWVVPPHNCPTGECDWEGYWTMAACTRCADITDRLERVCTPYQPATGNSSASGGCDVFLPNGLSTFNAPEIYFSQGWDPARNIMVMNTTLEPLVYNNFSDNFVTVQIIMGFDPDQLLQDKTQPLTPYVITENSPLVARECAVVPCVQNQTFFLTSKPESAVLFPEMKILQEWDTYTIGSDLGTGSISATVEFPLPDAEFAVDGQRTVTNVPTFGGHWYQDIRNWLREYLTGVTYTRFDTIKETWEFDTEVFEDSVPTQYHPPLTAILENSHMNRWGEAYCLRDDNSTKPDVECAMHKLAAGITNAIRTHAWQVLPADRKAAIGKSFEPVQICHAQWQYISAPVAVWALGLILFVGVVIKTRRANIKAWRTSPLATLLLRLDQDSRDQLQGWQRMGDAELREAAEQLRLRLRVDDEGPPRFVKREVERAPE